MSVIASEVAWSRLSSRRRAGLLDGDIMGRCQVPGVRFQVSGVRLAFSYPWRVFLIQLHTKEDRSGVRRFQEVSSRVRNLKSDTRHLAPAGYFFRSRRRRSSFTRGVGATGLAVRLSRYTVRAASFILRLQCSQPRERCSRNSSEFSSESAPSRNNS